MQFGSFDSRRYCLFSHAVNVRSDIIDVCVCVCVCACVRACVCVCVFMSEFLEEEKSFLKPEVN